MEAAEKLRIMGIGESKNSCGGGVNLNNVHIPSKYSKYTKILVNV